LLHPRNLFRGSLKDELPQIVPGGYGAVVIALGVGAGAKDGQRGDALLALAIVERCRTHPCMAGLLRETNSCVAAAGGMLAMSDKTTALLEASPDRLASSFSGVDHRALSMADMARSKPSR
jgi:hypothetical protein